MSETKAKEAAHSEPTFTEKHADACRHAWTHSTTSEVPGMLPKSYTVLYCTHCAEGKVLQHRSLPGFQLT